MVLATEVIMLPPRRNSYSGSTSESEKTKSPSKSHHWWFFTSRLKSSSEVGGSNHHIATQKLRESKWFKENEERIFCAVIETGFIVEYRLDENIGKNDQKDVNIDSEQALQQLYGIVSVELKKKEKKPTANEIFIYTLKKCENKNKIVKLSVVELWKDGYSIRINNMNDKTKHINAEKHIKNQITYAIKHKKNFHNCLHFVDYCRYTETGTQMEERKKLVSESVRYGGISAGLYFLGYQRERANSYSK